MDTDSFIIHSKTEDFYEDIADHVKEWFETLNYSEDDGRPLLRGINKKDSVFWGQNKWRDYQRIC